MACSKRIATALAGGLLTLFLVNPSFAADANGDMNHTEAEEASIPFADLNGIRSFRVIDSDTLQVTGRNGNVYRIEMFGYCPGLAFAEELLFITTPGGQLDRFSSVYVEGNRCHFRSIQRVEED